MVELRCPLVDMQIVTAQVLLLGKTRCKLGDYDVGQDRLQLPFCTTIFVSTFLHNKHIKSICKTGNDAAINKIYILPNVFFFTIREIFL